MSIGISTDSLEHLTKPQSIEELSAEQIIEDQKEKLIELHADIADLLALESEPAVKQIEASAYRETLVRARINDAFRAGLLYYAKGSDLDHLAAFYDLIRMVDEDDERFVARVVLGIQGRSTGGTEARYRLIALSSDLRVADAKPWVNGTDPLIYVAVFSTDAGGVADQALLNTVSIALNEPTVRMVGDRFNVVSAVTQNIDIEANVWLLPDAPASTLENLEGQLRIAHAQANGLGFDLVESWLISQLMRPGVQRIEMIAPSQDVIVTPMTAIALGTITLNDKGRDF